MQDRYKQSVSQTADWLCQRDLTVRFWIVTKSTDLSNLTRIFSTTYVSEVRKRKMAAHSGGVDWASVIKPLLNSGSLSKTDLNNLTKTILKW